MRTKTLLLTAAVLAVGLGASVAQSVFSVNAVGYVNVPIVPGYNLIANPLNGTNNLINTVIPAAALPNDTECLTWNPVTQDFNQVDFVDTGVWLDQNFVPSPTLLNPGEGVFIHHVHAGNFTLTFVGDVPQGALTNTVNHGFDFKSSIVPQSVGLSTIGFPGVQDMQFQTFNPTIQDYDQPYTFDGGIWVDPSFNPADPTPAVAQGFLITNPGGAQKWGRTFSVN